MPYKICYWDNDAQEQRERDSTPEEDAQRAADIAAAAIPVVPQVVGMKQARLALLRAGKLATVIAAIASMPGAIGDEARIEWEYATLVHRNHYLTLAMQGVMGASDAEIDALFIVAGGIE